MSGFLKWLVICCIWTTTVVNALEEKPCPGFKLGPSLSRSTQSHFVGRPGFSPKILNKLRRFRNCTVIEGNIWVATLDLDKIFNDFTFPYLREVTGYVSFYQNTQLKHLNNIFPKLAVIRGRSTIINYSLLVVGIQEMDRLGMVNLRKISRGNAWFEKLSRICFLQKTIDWKSILPKGLKPEFRDIQDPEQCLEWCDMNCKNNYCWGPKEGQCQLMCEKYKGDEGCHVYTNGTEIRCDRQCYGGCEGPGPDMCLACKSYWHQGSCVDRCPVGYLIYHDRRCVSHWQCLNDSKIIKHNKKCDIEPMKIHQGHCVPDCPFKFKEDPENKTRCIPCDHGQCEKVCPPVDISHIGGAEDVAKFENCTVVDGNLGLLIEHKQDELDDWLPRMFGKLKRITGGLKVQRSHALRSLDFFKSLEVIEGKNIGNDSMVPKELDGCSLIIMNNRMLSGLWGNDWGKNRSLKIDGLACFHFNPFLCKKTIKTLLGEEQYQSSKVTASNGGQAICDFSKLDLEVKSVSAKSVKLILSSKNMTLKETSYFLGYTIFYMKTDQKNVSVVAFGSTGSCEEDKWSSTGNLKFEFDNRMMSNDQTLSNLQPYTRYAAYILGSTVTDKYAALSQVVYFRTKEAKPTGVVDIRTEAISPHAIRVTFGPPKNPNGLVTHYKIYYQELPFSMANMPNRDFCQKQGTHHSRPHVANPVIDEKRTLENTTCASCMEACQSKQSSSQTPASRLLTKRERALEEAEGDLVSTKLTWNSFFSKTKRNKCHLNKTRKEDFAKIHQDKIMRKYQNGALNLKNFSFTQDQDLKELTDKFPLPAFNDSMDDDDGNTTWPSKPHRPYLLIETKGNSIVIQNLSHFTHYTIEIIACHNYNHSQRVIRCSDRTYTSAQTKRLESADTVDHNKIDVEVDGTTLIFHWKPPEVQNIPILRYDIRYQLKGSSQLPHELCVSYKDFEEDCCNKEFKSDDAIAPGTYEYQIRAISTAFYTDSRNQVEKWSVSKTFEIQSDFDMTIILVLIAVIVILIICVVAVFVVFSKKYRKSFEASANPEYHPFEYKADEWEIDRSQIFIGEYLANGNFGKVYKGYAELDPEDPMKQIEVAIKTVAENADIRDWWEFLMEADTMKQFKTTHVVQLIGVVSKTKPSLVIMELMQGDLKTYLRARRPDGDVPAVGKPPSVSQIWQMAADIADGMAYLHDKKFCHRDLAARNCMVASDDVVKIGDFGMTRDIYEKDYYRKGGKGLLPVRWMAPEALKDGLFTTYSDVWSYGVVLWEMVTLAEQPYQGLSNPQVLDWVLNHNFMDQPPGCPDNLYELMKLCWLYRPRDRPTFIQLLHLLNANSGTNDHFKDTAYIFSPEFRDSHMSETDSNLALDDYQALSKVGKPITYDDDDENDDSRTHLLKGAQSPSVAMEMETMKSSGKHRPKPHNRTLRFAEPRHSDDLTDRRVDTNRNSQVATEATLRGERLTSASSSHSGDIGSASVTGTESSKSMSNGCANGHVNTPINL